jgi:hypothetical protein
MKTKMMASALFAAALFVSGIGAAGQGSSQDQTIQDQSKPGMMGGGVMGQGAGQGQGMMGGGMMGMMGQMTAHHQQMSTLINNLMQSMAAIQSEKDPEALKSKLARHQALLKEMQSQMMQQGNRMQMMSGQVNQYCPAQGDAAKAPTK